MTKQQHTPTSSSPLREYRLAIGPNKNLYICVKEKPHLIYSLAAFEQLVKAGKVRP